jgi:hypothetical protein
MAQGADWFDTRGWLTRAVVIQVYYADDDGWNTRGWTKGNMRGVCCDVRTYGRYSRPLWRVPVLQRTHGLHDEDVFVPRASSQDISGSGANMVAYPSGSGGTRPTPAESLDGDHVIVGFLEGNPASPVILPFCLPHPGSPRKLQSSGGRVRRIRHAGVMIEWSEDGNLSIDASGAAKEKLGSGGTEQSNSGSGGTITIQTKDGSGDTSSLVFDASGGVRLLDGGGDYLELTKSGTATLSAPLVNLATGPREPLLKGNAYVAAESTLYAILTTHLAAAAESWAQIAAKLPIIDKAAVAGTTAGAWAAAIVTWGTQSAAAKSLKTQTG